jgi:hypothetical protein
VRAVSAADSAVAVLVVPTNEELEIAEQALDVVHGRVSASRTFSARESDVFSARVGRFRRASSASAPDQPGTGVRP